MVGKGGWPGGWPGGLFRWLAGRLVKVVYRAVGCLTEPSIIHILIKLIILTKSDHFYFDIYTLPFNFMKLK